MKKIVFVAVIAMAVVGAAWAQSPSPAAPSPGQALSRPTFVSAVPMLSTEAKNTAGVFGGMADSFIDPRYHDPNMEGTFLLAGGDLALGGISNRVDLGFARNFGAFYLGAYLGGSFMNGFGGRTQQSESSQPIANEREDRRSSSLDWNTNLAVLLGVANMGFRLDFIMPSGTNARNSTKSGVTDNSDWTLRSQPAVALSWGADMGQILPWARIGFQFPMSIPATGDATGGHDNSSSAGGATNASTLRNSSGSGLEITGGATYLLGEASSLGGELWFSNRFRTTRKTTSSVTGADDTEAKIANSGLTGFGLSLDFLQTVDAGPVALGFKPTLALGVTVPNRNGGATPATAATNNKTDWEVIGNRLFSLATGVSVGATWQATQRMSLLTGVSMRLFDWTTSAEVGKDTLVTATPAPEAQHSSWRFSGVALYNFHLGLNFAANDAISMGFRLDPLVNGLFGNAPGNPSFDFTLTALLGK